MNRTANIFDPKPVEGRIDIGGLAGSSETLAFVYEIAPGGSSCPYHYEYVEEWMLVISGEVTVRTPDGEQTVAAGEMVRFPAGPQGAHKIFNRGETTCRTLMFSAVGDPAVSVYPDSNKVGVWPAGERPTIDGHDDLIFVRDSAVPWSHGEDGWDRADPA